MSTTYRSTTDEQPVDGADGSSAQAPSSTLLDLIAQNFGRTAHNDMTNYPGCEDFHLYVTSKLLLLFDIKK